MQDSHVYACIWAQIGQSNSPTWQVYMEISGGCLNVLWYYLFPLCMSSRKEEIPGDNVCVLFRSHCIQPNIVPPEILII